MEQTLTDLLNAQPELIVFDSYQTIFGQSIQAAYIGKDFLDENGLSNFYKELAARIGIQTDGQIFTGAIISGSGELREVYANSKIKGQDQQVSFTIRQSRGGVEKLVEKYGPESRKPKEIPKEIREDPYLMGVLAAYNGLIPADLYRHPQKTKVN